MLARRCWTHVPWGRWELPTQRWRRRHIHRWTKWANWEPTSLKGRFELASNARTRSAGESNCSQFWRHSLVKLMQNWSRELGRLDMFWGPGILKRPMKIVKFSLQSRWLIVTNSSHLAGALLVIKRSAIHAVKPSNELKPLGPRALLVIKRGMAANSWHVWATCCFEKPIVLRAILSWSTCSPSLSRPSLGLVDVVPRGPKYWYMVLARRCKWSLSSGDAPAMR